MKKMWKRALSLILASTLLLGTVVQCFAANDDSGVIGVYKVEIFNKSELVTDKIVMPESTQLQLNYQMVDETVMPDNSYIKWWSETPTLVSVDQEGYVRAHDSSKGAVCRLWLDNEVKTIPIVGKIIAWPIEQLFNKIEVDQMDTDTIVAAVRELFSTDGVLGKYGSVYADKLCESLKYYLDNINSNIHVTLYDKDGVVLADDFVEIVVTRSTEIYSDLIPNGTHITNKDFVPTTVAVGSTVQLSAVTTPVRLRMGVVYTVKNSSLATSGKTIATVDDSGLVTFKNTGKVTIMVSPDTEGFINNLLKYINLIYGKVDGGSIDGVVNNDKVADILIKILGLDINRTVLIGILDVISFVVNDASNPVQWGATAVKILANFILQFTTNDTITFTVVDSIPVQSFEVGGVTTVTEGSETNLGITNVKPAGAVTGNVTWEISDPAVAYIDQQGTVRARDAGEGVLPKKEVTVTATIANGMQRSVKVTVKGRTGKLVSDVEIIGNQFASIGQTNQFDKVIYPVRAAETAIFQWGIVTTDENGEEKIVYATAEAPAANEFGQIDINGAYTPLSGGDTYIVAKAHTGKYFETSSAITKFKVSNGTPVSSITMDQGMFKTVEVGGSYYGSSTTLSATVHPDNASNKDITWKSSNKDITVDSNGNVAIKPGVEKSAYSIITATTEDGGFVASTYVSFVRNKVNGASMNVKTLDATVGKTSNISAKLSYEGSTGTLGDVVWNTSDKSVATVDQNGNVTGKETGKCLITATTVDGGFVAECEVTVRADKSYLDSIVRLVENTVINYEFERKDLYLDFARALDRCYYVQDEEMALQTSCDRYANELLMTFYRLDSFVQLTGIDITMDGKKAPDYISKKCSTSTSYKNNEIKLSYQFRPSNAMYKNISWTSSNSNVSVRNGVCKPTVNVACWSIITVKAEDYMGNIFTDKVYVAFVNYPVNGVSLDTTEIIGGKVNETKTIKANVSIDGLIGIVNSTVKDIVWTSSDDKIASVDGNGKITFNYGGNCVITATTVDGGFVAECKVNVVTNFAVLSATIKNMENLGLKEIDYLPDSWKTLWATVDEGRAMLEAGTATQKEVDAMVQKINDARTSMVKYNHIQKIKIYLNDEEAPEHLTYDCSVFGEGFNYKNAKVNLGVRLYPTDANYKDVIWSSDNPNVKVTNDGVVSPAVNKPCYANISVLVRDDFGVEFTDSIYVVYAFTPATGVTLDKTTFEGNAGDSMALKPTVAPKGYIGIDGASIKEVLWYSEDDNIASVANDGTVLLKSTGATNIVCKTVDGGFEAKCLVVVKGDKSAIQAAIELYKDTDLMNYEYVSGQNFAAALKKAQEVNESVYSTQAQIDTACQDLINAYNSLVDYVFLDKMEILYNGQPVGNYLPIKVTTSYYHNTDITLTYNTAPSDAMIKTIEWSTSNNKNSIEVTNNGNSISLSPKYDLDVVNAKGGYVDVTLTATDFYGRTMTKTVTVSFAKKQATGIAIDKNAITTTVFDEPIAINATVTPSDANFKDVRWVSSNPNIAKVENGVVTAINTGSCIITAYTMDGGHSASCQVNVVTDRRVLTNAIAKAEAENLQRVDFTPESFDVYQAALEYAYRVAADLSLEQATVDSAANSLNAAREALVAYVPISEMYLTYNDEKAPESITIEVGNGIWTTKKIQLGVTINPNDAMFVSGHWSSSNSKISVDETGLCKPTISTPGYHSSVITYTATDHHGRTYSASTVVLFVDTAATGVELDKTQLNLNVSDTVKLNATVLPIKKTTAGITTQKPASCQEISWSTSNSNVVAVVDGTVVAVGSGTAVVTVKTLDGLHTATCTITVA